MSKADEAAIVAGQPGDLQGNRIGGDQRGGGHAHQSDDRRTPGTIAASQREGDHHEPRARIEMTIATTAWSVSPRAVASIHEPDPR